MSMICDDLVKKHSWNINLCCPICHGMGRYFTAVVRYKRNGHLQHIVTCCKGMRCVFEDLCWEVMGFDPDDGPFYECRSSDELEIPEWKRNMLHLKPKPPQIFPPSRAMTLAEAVAAVKRVPYQETHRRRN